MHAHCTQQHSLERSGRSSDTSVQFAEQPLPPRDVVDVWLVALDLPIESINTAVLSSDERERADRFLFAKDRSRFIVAHVALREILASCLQVKPSSLAFELNAFGKPALRREAGLKFNLSHSNNLAALAISSHDDVGIDIEVCGADSTIRDVASLAHTVCTPAEIKELESLHGEGAQHAFLHCWTRKEAYLKAIGTGFAQDPRGIHVGIIAKATTVPDVNQNLESTPISIQTEVLAPSNPQYIMSVAKSHALRSVNVMQYKNPILQIA
jgi:4'-phosphopantetheinyl transferase